MEGATGHNGRTPIWGEPPVVLKVANIWRLSRHGNNHR